MVIESIARIISETYDAPVDNILTVGVDELDNIYGTLLSNGGIYSYGLDENQVAVAYEEGATDDLHDYVEGSMAALGVHTDSDNPWEWSMGYLRRDAKAVCKKGKLCGNVCLPKNYKCKQHGSSGQVKGAKKKLRRGNAGVKGFVAGAATAAGIGAAGTLAAGAVGAGAYLVGRNKYKNDPNFKAQVDESVAKGKAAREELKLGFKNAKEIYKEGNKIVDKFGEAQTLEGNSVRRASRGGVAGSAAGTAFAGVENAVNIVRGKKPSSNQSGAADLQPRLPGGSTPPRLPGGSTPPRLPGGSTPPRLPEGSPRAALPPGRRRKPGRPRRIF